LISPINTIGDLYWCLDILAFRSFQSFHVTRSVINLIVLHREAVDILSECHHWTIESMLFYPSWLGNFPLVQEHIARYAEQAVYFLDAASFHVI
jgi:hypothetical protein